MEEYVVPEFYDVLVGGTDASGSPGTGGGGSVATGNAKATWDENGITGNGWTLPTSWEEPKEVYVYGATNEEIKSKVAEYLMYYGGLYEKNHGFSNCIEF